MYSQSILSGQGLLTSGRSLLHFQVMGKDPSVLLSHKQEMCSEVTEMLAAH